MSSPSSSSAASGRGGTIPVLVVFAPTASGKTALVRSLFGNGSLFCFKGMAEAVSADSQAVYRGLDVGTAKPSLHERDGVPYHLLDVVPPERQFGLGDFMQAADSLCRDIWGRGHLPVVVGGTGFYIRSFLMGSPFAPGSDGEARRRIRARLSEEGAAALHAELSRVDPVSAGRIHVNDVYRICRALEVYQAGGIPLSAYTVPSRLRDGFDFCTMILERGRDDLYRRIDERVDMMFAGGLCGEVARLKAAGCTAETPAMKAIGYREFFDGSLPAESGIRSRIKLDSRRYAKKQLSYVRGIPDAVTVGADDTEAVARVVAAFFRKWFPGSC